MEKKQIDFVTHPQGVHMVGDGFRVHNFIPGREGWGRTRTAAFLR